MRVKNIISYGFIIFFSSQVGAQVLTDPLLEQQRIDKLKERTSELGSFQPRGDVPDAGPAQQAVGPCFKVDHIIIEGATLLSPQELSAITFSYAPKCMQGADIQGVMRAIDKAYAEKGYITSKTYIPPQNLTLGKLTLKVIEGWIEGVFLVDGKSQIEGRRGQWQLNSAFPTQSGIKFNLQDFEQGLDQMNRLQSVDATIRLQPGNSEGGSYVIVQRLQEDRFRGHLRFDTLGSDANGKNQLSFDIAADDVIGINDSWSVSLSGSENTNSLSMYGSIPWRYWTFGIELGHSEYLSPLSPVSELFGTTETGTLSARYMLSRGQYSTTEINTSLTHRRGDRFINNSRLTPQKLSTFEIGFNHLRLNQTARNSFDGSIGIGLSAFGANQDLAHLTRDEPRAQFIKFSGGWQRQAALGKIGTLVNDLRLQYSPHTLYGSEQFVVGSYSTVRGYSETNISGESGAYLRSDLYLDPAIWSHILPTSMREQAMQKIQPYIFLDSGFAYNRTLQKTSTAAGLGFGFSADFDTASLSALIGMSLIDDQNRFVTGEPILQLRMDVKTW